jgi:serine/threonine-protein kinase
MELVEGETLANRIAHERALAPLEVLSLLAEVCDVLASVHARGITHRDLKPDNILLTPVDPEFPLRVIDWGVARLGPLGRLTLDGLTPGTPIYMSPEQAIGRNIGAPCDIYSLGVIAYECLTGHPPYDGRTLAEVVSMHLAGEPVPLATCSRAPRELCTLVHGMLEKDPSLRPGAIEIRQIARALALELPAERARALAANEPARRPHTVRPRQRVLAPPPTEDTHVIDPDALEFGATEMVPTIPRPRWTPDIGAASPRLVRPPITPRGIRDQVSGEIAIPVRARRR